MVVLEVLAEALSREVQPLITGTEVVLYQVILQQYAIHLPFCLLRKRIVAIAADHFDLTTSSG
jgi:hypothetical protein